MPPVPKRPDRRQRTNPTGLGLVEVRPVVEPPTADPKWLAVTRAHYEAFWTSPNAALVLPADLPALRRLFAFRDEQERALRAYRAEPVWKGSKGQPVVSGFAEEYARLERLVAPLEDRFGLSPLARLKLGVQFGQAAESLDAINAALAGDTDEDDDRGEDPRLSMIDVTPEPA